MKFWMNKIVIPKHYRSIGANGLQIGGRFNAANVLLYAVADFETKT